MLDEIERLATVEGDHVRLKRGTWVHVNTLLKEWDKILFSIPLYIVKIIQGTPHVRGYSAAAQKMMIAMSWAPGRGIGKNSEGIAEPVPTGTGQTSREGLGYTSRKIGKQKKVITNKFKE